MMFRLPYTWILLAFLIARVSYGAFTKSANTKKEAESCNLTKEKNNLPLAKGSDTIPASNGNISTVKSLYKYTVFPFFLIVSVMIYCLRRVKYGVYLVSPYVDSAHGVDNGRIRKKAKYTNIFFKLIFCSQKIQRKVKCNLRSRQDL